MYEQFIHIAHRRCSMSRFGDLIRAILGLNSLPDKSNSSTGDNNEQSGSRGPIEGNSHGSIGGDSHGSIGGGSGGDIGSAGSASG
jgi:hypothetical protein